LKYQIIINENAKAGKIKKVIPDLIELFKTNLKSYNFNITKDLNELPKIKQNMDGSYDAVIAIGGDGTLNGVINAFYDETKLFGLIPLGTGNDFPLMLGLKNSITEAIQLIKSDNIKNIDLGRLKTEKYQKYFINAVGIGFDAKVGYTKNKITFISGGLSKYIFALLSSLISYRSTEISINIDKNKIIKNKCFLMTIGNGKRTGGGFLLTPNAVFDDGNFDICYCREISKLKVIRNFTKVLKGMHLDMDEVDSFRAKEIVIKSEQELFLHFDGETPERVKNIDVSLLPRKIRVFSL
jgi:diacylglycerol kinase (ATP)